MVFVLRYLAAYDGGERRCRGSEFPERGMSCQDLRERMSAGPVTGVRVNVPPQVLGCQMHRRRWLATGARRSEFLVTSILSLLHLDPKL